MFGPGKTKQKNRKICIDFALPFCQTCIKYFSVIYYYCHDYYYFFKQGLKFYNSTDGQFHLPSLTLKKRLLQINPSSKYGVYCNNFWCSWINVLFYIFVALLFDILILFVNASLTNCLQSLLAFLDQCVTVLTFVYISFWYLNFVYKRLIKKVFIGNNYFPWTWQNVSEY